MLFRVFGPLRTVFSVIGGVFLLVSLAVAVDPEPNPAADTTAAPNLAATQEAIEMRYRRFEGTLQQLSEYLRKTDPARAELLIRAIGKSKEGRIPDQLQNLTDILKKDQLGDAVERQELVVGELQSLLELLMSEARKDEIELEKKRLQDLIKDVTKLIGKEMDARAETERGSNPSNLENGQKKVADSTGKLVEKIKSQDAAKKLAKNEKGKDSTEKDSSEKNSTEKNDPSGEQKSDSDDADSPPSPKEGKPGDEKPQPDKKSGDEKSPKPDQDKPDQGQGKKDPETDDKEGKKPEDKESKPSDSSKPGDSTKPGDSEKGESQKDDSKQGKSKPSKKQPSKSEKSKPSKGKPQEGQEQDQPPQEGQEQKEQQDPSSENEDSSQQKQDKTPGRDEVQRAKLEMDRAIEELKKNNKKGASDKQDKAIAELMKAKEKLEEILRQIREEEREMVLAQMESRFRDMLLKQEAVYNATLAVHAVPVDDRTDRHRNRAVELARNEDEISLLAAKALTLLKEEGSSVAFPEAVEQIRDDMISIARRLERVEVGEITQNIEQDTIESLKEIIEAMQKELEKLKDKKQQQDQKQQQQPQQAQGLVNKLAEMKMLRSLQYRVNRRTRQLGRLVEGEQAVDADLVIQLRQLSDRQAKVQKATYDLATGKNQ